MSYTLLFLAIGDFLNLIVITIWHCIIINWIEFLMTLTHLLDERIVSIIQETRVSSASANRRLPKISLCATKLVTLPLLLWILWLWEVQKVFFIVPSNHHSVKWTKGNKQLIIFNDLISIHFCALVWYLDSLSKLCREIICLIDEEVWNLFDYKRININFNSIRSWWIKCIKLTQSLHIYIVYKYK